MVCEQLAAISLLFVEITHWNASFAWTTFRLEPACTSDGDWNDLYPTFLVASSTHGL